MMKEINELLGYLTQKTLASILGVSDRMIRYYKSGRSKPSRDKIEKIKKILTLINKVPKPKSKKEKKEISKRILLDLEGCKGKKFLENTKDVIYSDLSLSMDCKELEEEIINRVYSELAEVEVERQDLFLGAVDFMNFSRRQRDTLQEVKEYLYEFAGSGLFFDVYLTEWGTYAIEFYS